MVQVYVGLGSNQGDSPTILTQAIISLANIGTIGRISSLYRTEPQDLINQPDFFNVVVELWTGLAIEELLQQTQGIEAQAGRVRLISKGPRTLDIDLLSYGQLTMATDTLVIPHPRLAIRRFVLAPLLEIAPQISVPGIDQDLFELLNRLEGQGIYAIHPLLYNQPDIWTSPLWSLDQNQIKTQATDFD